MPVRQKQLIRSTWVVQQPSAVQGTFTIRDNEMANVTAPTYLCKQPGETRSYTMNFANLMVTGETINSVETPTSELRGGGTSDLIITDTAIDGQTITVTIAGGTDRFVYRVEITIVTSGSQTLVGDGILSISTK